MDHNQNNETQTQEAAILEHLLLGRSITPLDALTLYKCMRLGARIFSPRKQNYPIERKMITTPTGKRVASYYMNSDWLRTQRVIA